MVYVLEFQRIFYEFLFPKIVLEIAFNPLFCSPTSLEQNLGFFKGHRELKVRIGSRVHDFDPVGSLKISFPQIQEVALIDYSIR